MFPAVIFHVAEGDDLFAVDVVEGIQPGSVIEIGDVAVMRRFEDHLAIVLRFLERGPKPCASDVVRGNEVDCSLVVAERAGGGIGNINLLAGFLLRIEGGDWRTVEKIGRGRIDRPFGTRECKFSGACERGVFDVACERDAVDVEFFALEGSEELVWKGDSESMRAAIRVVALAVNGGLVREIGRACHDVRSRRFVAGGVVRVDVDGDRAAIALLAGPAVDVVLVALEGDAVNDASDGAGGWFRA